MNTTFVMPAPALSGPWKLFSGALEIYKVVGGYALEPSEIIARVAAAEGSSDSGPDAEAFEQAFAIYCESVERDARPHGLGRFYLHRRMCQVAVRARLRIAPYVRAGARPRRAPLIVCGLPRSGTTLLHRLLSLADDGAAVPHWQLVEPMPPPHGPDRRREAAERSLGRMKHLVPVSVDAQHEMRTDLPDECGYLLCTSFLGGMPWQVPAYGWLEWSLRQDTSAAYRAWAAYLSQLERPGKRLVLKYPFHAANLTALHAACPDAFVVQTHRDPLDVLPSFHKLFTSFHAALVSRIDVPRTVRAHTQWLLHLVDRAASNRTQFPAKQWTDVDYRALVANPIATVARVCEAFGLPVSEGHISRMRQWLGENPKGKHGDNPYSLEAFGQRRDEVAEMFSAYRRRHDFDGPTLARR